MALVALPEGGSYVCARPTDDKKTNTCQEHRPKPVAQREDARR